MRGNLAPLGSLEVADMHISFESKNVVSVLHNVLGTLVTTVGEAAHGTPLEEW
jgi:hypothetical protein